MDKPQTTTREGTGRTKSKRAKEIYDAWLTICGPDIWSLASERDDLKRWKSEAMQVMNGIDLQEVGKEMDLTLGEDIGPKILPYIKALKGKLS